MKTDDSKTICMLLTLPPPIKKMNGEGEDCRHMGGHEKLDHLRVHSPWIMGHKTFLHKNFRKAADHTVPRN
jgi:hypothetical protein